MGRRTAGACRGTSGIGHHYGSDAACFATVWRWHYIHWALLPVAEDGDGLRSFAFSSPSGLVCALHLCYHTCTRTGYRITAAAIACIALFAPVPPCRQFHNALPVQVLFMYGERSFHLVGRGRYLLFRV